MRTALWGRHKRVTPPKARASSQEAHVLKGVSVTSHTTTLVARLLLQETLGDKPRASHRTLQALKRDFPCSWTGRVSNTVKMSTLAYVT